jgi:hypothetical protein
MQPQLRSQRPSSSGRFSTASRPSPRSGLPRRGVTTPPRRTPSFGRSQPQANRTPRFSRGQAPTWRSPAFRRHQPKQSKPQQMVSKVGGMLPAALSGKTASKATSKARKPAGLALLAGAAGLAMKNRDKIGGMLRRDKQQAAQPHTDSYAEPVPPMTNTPAPTSTRPPM